MNARPNQVDLLQALGALADEKPGEYTVAQLLPTYNTWAETQGLPVIGTNALSSALRREVTLDRRGQTPRGVTVWHLSKAGLECRNWHL